MTRTTRTEKPVLRWRSADEIDSGVLAAVNACGGRMNRLAEKLGVTPQAVSQWKVIPLSRLLEIEELTKVDREILRPDLYARKPKPKRKRKTAKRKAA